MSLNNMNWQLVKYGPQNGSFLSLIKRTNIKLIWGGGGSGGRGDLGGVGSGGGIWERGDLGGG